MEGCEVIPDMESTATWNKRLWQLLKYLLKFEVFRNAYIDNICSGFSTGKHRGYPSTSSVMSMDMDGEVRVLLPGQTQGLYYNIILQKNLPIPDRIDQDARRVGLQQSGHILYA